jgi:hypothetical protein
VSDDGDDMHYKTASAQSGENACEPDHSLLRTELVYPAFDLHADEAAAYRTSATCSELGSQRIRLVKILPGPLGDAIECRTSVFFMDQAEEYTALSYTWGSAVLQHQIMVDQLPRLVTTNLWRFLRQARQLHIRFSGWLWIDALCIDQSDPWEKLEQVKMIGKIFKGAMQTIVWLGPAYGHSDRAVKALADWSRSLPYQKSSRALWAPPIEPAIKNLCERPYWRRLWVFQELESSQNVRVACGSEQIRLEYLKRFLFASHVGKRAEEKLQSLQQSPAASMLMMARGAVQILDTDLMSVLYVTQSLRCSDPRDKVYAVLNAVNPWCDIEADYTISLPALLNKVLTDMQENHMPSSLKGVAEQCVEIETLFGVETDSMYEVDGRALPVYPNPLRVLSSKQQLKQLRKDHRKLEHLLRSLHVWYTHYGHFRLEFLIHDLCKGLTRDGWRLNAWNWSSGLKGVLEALEQPGRDRGLHVPERNEYHLLSPGSLYFHTESPPRRLQQSRGSLV